MIGAGDVQALLGTPVLALQPLQGGDLSDVVLARLPGGTQAVVKRGPMTSIEARMLQSMGQAGAPVPQVLACSGDLLALEYLAEGRSTPDAWLRLGGALRWIHEQTGPAYGWAEDYAFGPLPIPGGPRDTDWPAFWAAARLRPSLPHIPLPLAHRINRLCNRLPDLLPAHPPAALLHGDLWQGNLHFGPAGAVHLLDPACCYGDAEVDLAMLHLFGSPGPAFAEGYGPLASGWQDRRPIYQLWPALVHLRLFGGGYGGLVTTLLDRLGA